MFLELHHIGDYTIFSHNIMNYLTSIKAAWHKKKSKKKIKKKKSKKIWHLHLHKILKQHYTFEYSEFLKIIPYKSYCTSECSTKLKKLCYTFEYSILSKVVLYVRVQYKLKICAIRPSIAFFQKSYCTSECSTKLKIVLYVQV